jgi:hypothetical protein
MRRLLWPSFLLIAFGVGLATGWGRGGRMLPVTASTPIQPGVAALQEHIATLPFVP